MHGALINGLETRVNQIEIQLSNLDARGSEEHDNLANERELHRFILTGEFFDSVKLIFYIVNLVFNQVFVSLYVELGLTLHCRFEPLLSLLI